MNLECFVEDLFLGGQWSIILGYRRLSVKSLLVQHLQERNPRDDPEAVDLDLESTHHQLWNNYYERDGRKEESTAYPSIK